MSLDHLWAGWRSSYVASVSESEASSEGPPREETCVFCRIVAGARDEASSGVVATTEFSVALLNAYPYASGHLLVMPARHVGELALLSPEESADLWNLTTTAAAAIEAAYHPDGMNIGANLGRAAGAGIPRHLHIHVLPRWIGDTNFMTSVASTRVLPESLAETWTKLRSNWPS